MKKNFKNEILSYLITDKLFYETPDRYNFNKDDFLNPVSRKLDNNWLVKQKGVWINCLYLPREFPIQGWKIHLSTIPEQSIKLLDIVTDFLIEEKTSFKFLLSKSILKMVNSKSWSRGGSGKFITIYPYNEKHFKYLLGNLYNLVKNFKGPFILSDRRYKDCKVLYYRYGGLKFNYRLSVDGYKVPILISPEGKEIVDMRNPYYVIPTWVKNIIKVKERMDGKSGLYNNRFLVEKAISFSNSGGVYIAKDDYLKKRVVIKETRPFIFFSDNKNAFDIARKEYFLLEKLKSTNIAPKPIKIFREWEHIFLVEEYLERYVTLKDFSTSIIFSSKPTKEEIIFFLNNFMNIFRNLAEKIEVLHKHNIIFGDFSINNVMINPNNQDIRLVDFEGAVDITGDSRGILFTNGFADKNQLRGKNLQIENDYYAFGAVMFNYLTSMNSILGIKPSIVKELMKELEYDFGFPKVMRNIILSFMNDKIRKRPNPSIIINSLKDKVKDIQTPNIDKNNKIDHMNKIIKRIISMATEFIVNSADYKRVDRLFPSDPEMYETNPLSLDYGASGVISALYGVSEKLVTKEMISWITDKNINHNDYPPGLHIGISGIAWTFLELGDINYAEKIFSLTFNHPLLFKSPTLYSGLSGWGLANLKFWIKTKKSIYIENAKKAGDNIIKILKASEKGLYWCDENKKVSLGYLHGSSGMGLFFLYLYLVTKDNNYKKFAINLLNFDLNNAVITKENGYSWPEDKNNRKIIYPYLEYGSAGVGIVCLRYEQVFKDKKYSDIINKIYIDCDRKYAVSPSRNLGLAGIGEFLYDAYMFRKDRKYIHSIRKIIEGIKLFGIETPDGLVFPGKGLHRASCDYATGSAGIISFLARLIGKRKNQLLLLDELTEGRL